MGIKGTGTHGRTVGARLPRIRLTQRQQRAWDEEIKGTAKRGPAHEAILAEIECKMDREGVTVLELATVLGWSPRRQMIYLSRLLADKSIMRQANAVVRLLELLTAMIARPASTPKLALPPRRRKRGASLLGPVSDNTDPSNNNTDVSISDDATCQGDNPGEEVEPAGESGGDIRGQ